VLLLGSDPQMAAVWRDALEPAGFWVAADTARGPADLIVAIAVCDVGEAWNQPSAAEVGRIVVGEIDLTAEARLPRDATPREIQQTCRLLAEVVRLRREQAAGERRQRMLARMAHLDPLTGLPNRRAWDERVGDLFRQAQRRADLPIGMALVDLDHLKLINDTRGHLAGDDLLRLTGAALRGSLRASDLVARLGGDEFGLLLTGLDPAAAYATVDRVRLEMLRKLPAELGATVTASAGLCVALPLEATAEEMFAGADLALREAKRLGRNRTISGRLLWESDERRTAAPVNAAAVTRAD
jgi:diguanylate cyclase (GGDEF)-like protein